jgi:hypothetical protein
MRMRRILKPYVASLALPQYLINGTIFGKKNFTGYRIYVLTFLLDFKETCFLGDRPSENA